MFWLYYLVGVMVTVLLWKTRMENEMKSAGDMIGTPTDFWAKRFKVCPPKAMSRLNNICDMLLSRLTILIEIKIFRSKLISVILLALAVALPISLAPLFWPFYLLSYLVFEIKYQILKRKGK
jgi:hypothetical protein